MPQASNTVNPLTCLEEQQVIKRTKFYLEKARELFDVEDPRLTISFNLKGRTAGMYRIKRRQREIRYNSHIFSKFFTENIDVTVPHEVAHFVTDKLYGLNNIKPHGEEWKSVMHAFSADASVTADFDLSGIPLQSHSNYTYRCQCQEHQLSSIRHNKITKKRYQYYCKFCKEVLIYTPQLQFEI